MANSTYGKYRQAKASYSGAGLSAPIDVLTDAIKIALVSSSYTPDVINNQFVSDLGANRLGDDQTLATKTVSNIGVFRSADITWTTTPNSGQVGCLVLYKDTGVTSTSPLIGVISVASINGGPTLPISLTLNGGQVIYNVDPANGLANES